MKHLTVAALLAVLIGASGLLSACNTMKGAGQDVQDAGQGIENAAERNDGDDN